MNLCARCNENYPTVTAFDAHPCMLASLDLAAPAALREQRRTGIVVIGPDTVRLCEPECRNEVLLDLGVKSGGGGWVYPPHGSATVTVECTGKVYEVTWKRCRPSALHCDLCAYQWRYRIPALVAISASASARVLTDRQRAALARGRGMLGSRSSVKAPDRENPAA